MSGLYFRGKLAYARRFAQLEEDRQDGHVGAGSSAPPAPPPSPIQVITPTRGLQAPEAVISCDLLREFASVDVQSDDARYRKPLDHDLERLARALPAETRVVLLGSIATGKYVDALTVVFGQRLHYPSAFVGRGDMSRGGLLLRSVAAGAELEYTPLAAGASRHGARPPKLPPIRRR